MANLKRLGLISFVAVLLFFLAHEVTAQQLWRQAINGTGNSFDVARAVAVDSVGNVIAAGYATNLGTFHDFTVIKFDGVSGAELWRRVINGAANDYDQANAVAVDGAGNVVAAGQINTDTGADFSVNR